MTLFRMNLLMRQSCFKCRYPGNFQSDITISDFGGIERIVPDIPVKGGGSLILPHNESGIALVETMIPDPIPIASKDYLEYNRNLIQATEKPGLYDEFWKAYKEHGIEYVLEKYGGNNLKGKMKFETKKFLRDSGTLAIGKKIFGRA